MVLPAHAAVVLCVHVYMCLCTSCYPPIAFLAKWSAAIFICIPRMITFATVVPLITFAIIIACIARPARWFCTIDKNW